MPLYEYLCGSCGHRFERIQKFSDPPVTECPSCGGQVEKQVSSPAIQFKGSGWYITDYAKSGKDGSKSESTGKASDTASDSGGGAKAEKSAASTDTAASTSTPAPAKADTK